MILILTLIFVIKTLYVVTAGQNNDIKRKVVLILSALCRLHVQFYFKILLYDEVYMRRTESSLKKIIQYLLMDGFGVQKMLVPLTNRKRNKQEKTKSMN